MTTCILPTAAMDQHGAVLGKTGSGKSYGAKGIVEGWLNDGRQVCIIDPTSAWWGLRADSTGKRAGFDRVLLIGGDHQDLPLHERSGAACARLITEQGASAAIDTSGMTVGEYTRWFIDFAGTLYSTIRGPLHLVIDEAHQFMPQGKSPDVDAGRMLHAGNRLMSGGRSKGIRGLMITQRPAKLHKDSLTCADYLMAFRVIAPQDRQAIREWIDGAGDPDQGRDVLASLAGLKRGECWVWYPEGGHLQRVTCPKIRTYDSGATPAHGVRSSAVIAPVDLDAARASMAEAVKEAEANDPRLLRKKIADLQAELRKTAAPAGPSVADVAMRRAQAAAARAALEGLQVARDRIGAMIDTGRAAMADIEAAAAGLGWANQTGQAVRAPKGSRDGHADRGASEGEAEPASSSTRTPPADARSTAGASSGLTVRQQGFLDAAMALQSMGAGVTIRTVCAWRGVSPKGGSARDDIRTLAKCGYIVTAKGGGITVTPAGIDRAHPVSRADALKAAIDGLSERQARIFSIVRSAWPEHVTIEVIAESMGISAAGGSFRDDARALVGRGIATRDGGALRAVDFLMDDDG